MPLNSRKDPIKSLERIREKFGIQVKRPRCAYLKWEVSRPSTLRPESQVDFGGKALLIDIVLLRLGRCSSLLQWGKNGLCVTCGPDCYQKAVRVSLHLLNPIRIKW